MATRTHRLSAFNVSAPPSQRPLQVLCEDHNGTYLLPYLCEFAAGGWRNCASRSAIEADVIGWREPEPARDRTKR